MNDILTLIIALAALILFIRHLRSFPDFRGIWIRINGQERQITKNNYNTITVDKPFDTSTNGIVIIDDLHNNESEQS
jgi:hypothetical protein